MAVTDQTCMSHHASLAPTSSLPSIWQMLSVWRTRRQLRALDAAQLADIGVSAKAAQTEAKRPIWDVPTTWRN